MEHYRAPGAAKPFRVLGAFGFGWDALDRKTGQPYKPDPKSYPQVEHFHINAEQQSTDQRQVIVSNEQDSQGPSSTPARYRRGTDRSWRYTEWEAAGTSRALFDHDADPHELRNLAHDPAHAQIVARLRGQLLASPVSSEEYNHHDKCPPTSWPSSSCGPSPSSARTLPTSTAFKGKATGWFRVEQLGGRWFFITPEGNAGNGGRLQLLVGVSGSNQFRARMPHASAS